MMKRHAVHVDDIKDGPMNHIPNWEYISAEALELFGATFTALKKKDPRPNGKYNCEEVWEILGKKCICHCIKFVCVCVYKNI